MHRYGLDELVHLIPSCLPRLEELDVTAEIVKSPTSLLQAKLAIEGSRPFLQHLFSDFQSGILNTITKLKLQYIGPDHFVKRRQRVFKKALEDLPRYPSFRVYMYVNWL